MLPCALCHAPRWKTHGKEFYDLCRAFYDLCRAPVAKPLFPIVKTGLAVHTLLLAEKGTPTFVMLTGAINMQYLTICHFLFELLSLSIHGLAGETAKLFRHKLI
jgi:hypothetical protein